MVHKEMLFKDISYLELWRPFRLVEWTYLCNFGRRHHEELFCEIIFEFGPVVFQEPSKQMFKNISYLELWLPFCSAVQFGRGIS